MNMSHRHLEENSAGSPRGDVLMAHHSYEAQNEVVFGSDRTRTRTRCSGAAWHASSFLRPSPSPLVSTLEMFEHREEGPVGSSDH